MITPLKLTLEGFRSFQKEQTFRFPKGSGFYMMSGRNKVRPRLGGNGTGKSSFWDGFSWTLYGKTARGLRSSDVGNWEGEHLTSGTLVIRKDHVYTIRRTWRPNTLTLQDGEGEPRTVEQEEIDQLIGLNYESMISTVLMGQFNQFFFDLPPTRKLKVFSDALNLNYWVERSEMARKKASALSDEVREMELRQTYLRGRIVTLTESRDFSRKDRQNKARQREEQIAVLTGFIMGMDAELKRFTRDLKKVRKKRLRLTEEEDRECRRAIRSDDKVRETERTVENLRKDLNTTRQQIEAYSRRIAEFDKDPDKCPTCGQPVKDTNHLRKEKEYLIGRRGQLRKERDELKEAIKEEKKRFLIHKGSTMGTATRIGEIRSRLHRIRKMEMARAREVDQAEEILRRKRETLKRIREEKPKEEELQRVERELTASTFELQDLENKLEERQVESMAYGEWATLFKDLRLWLVEEAVAQLEVEVGNSLQELGLEGWEVKCRVERTTKQGKINRGFNVFIRSPESGKREVKWESWCGGETQRLRIAGALGLQRLILGRTGVQFPLEVWDEPTAHLSEEGVGDLLQFFGTRSKEEGRQVWLVDHRSLKAGTFDGEVRIVMGKYGSKIVKENR
jgi:DNA repair exonuclease SbcCD ATPase subunit